MSEMSFFLLMANLLWFRELNETSSTVLARHLTLIRLIYQLDLEVIQMFKSVKYIYVHVRLEGAPLILPAPV